MQEIKPCPFCGGKAHGVRVYDLADEFINFSVVCNDCGATIIRAGEWGECQFKSSMEAVEFWNRRTT